MTTPSSARHRVLFVLGAIALMGAGGYVSWRNAQIADRSSPQLASGTLGALLIGLAAIAMLLAAARVSPPVRSPSAASNASRGWSWEAALTPFWGWPRHKPIAIVLSVVYPMLVNVVMSALGPATKQTAITAYVVVGAGYALLYGALGYAMPSRPAPIGSVYRVVALLILVVANLFPIAAVESSGALQRMQLSTVKAQLRLLMEAQDAFHADQPALRGVA